MSCECCDKTESRSQIHEVEGEEQGGSECELVRKKRVAVNGNFVVFELQIVLLHLATSVCVCVGVIPKNVFIYACMDSHPPHLNYLNYLISLASSNTFYDWANRL